MKKITLLISVIFYGITSISAQNIEFTFANSQNTNDGVDDYYEVDVMIKTIDGQADFKLGSGQFYFNYNTAAFGNNIYDENNESTDGIDITFPNDGNPGGYIAGQSIDFAQGFYIYDTFIVNNNTDSRISWSYSQDFSAGTFADNNVTGTPAKLCHIKLRYVNVANDPMVTFETSINNARDQFYSACGPFPASVNDKANCTSDPGEQFVNAEFNSSGATLSVSEVGIIGHYKVHPNPTEGVLNIEGNTLELKSIDIYSMLGQKLMTVDSQLEQLNLTSLTSGVLFVKLNSETGSRTYKVIKR